MYVVDVTFPESRTNYSATKRYSYIHNGPEMPEPGDLAIVIVSGMYKLTNVREVRKYRNEDSWLKHTFRLISLAAERKVEQTAVERRNIERRLDELLQTRSKVLMYEQMAVYDPEARELLRRLRQL